MSASATVFVPAANGSSSKTPMGPFQNTVVEPRMIVANASAVSGPMSSPSPVAPAGVPSMASARVTSWAASAENPSATTTSVGSTIFTPRSSASAR